MIENEKQFMEAARRLASVEIEGKEAEKLRDELLWYDSCVNPDREGDWMPLWSGKRVWPLDPRPGDFDIKDIAHSLARINRFNGHTNFTYSVAQHAVILSQYCEFPMQGLNHDDGEAILGDVITPIKRLIRQLYEPMEEKVILAMGEQFDFEMDQEHIDCVKFWDLTLLSTEVRDITGHGVLNPAINVKIMKPLKERLTPWTPEEAEHRFLERFHELAG